MKDIITIGKFLFKKHGQIKHDVVKTKQGDYVNLRNENSQFLVDAVLREMNLSNDYDVYVKFKNVIEI